MASLPRHADGRGCHAAAVAGLALPRHAQHAPVAGPRPPRRDAALRRRGSRSLGPRPPPRAAVASNHVWRPVEKLLLELDPRTATRPASAARPGASLRSPQPPLAACRARRGRALPSRWRGPAASRPRRRSPRAAASRARPRSAAARGCRRAPRRATRELGAAAASATTSRSALKWETEARGRLRQRSAATASPSPTWSPVTPTKATPGCWSPACKPPSLVEGPAG
jgi:hypothetical protein